MALVALWPQLIQARAYVTGQVNQNGYYSVRSTNGLVTCGVPTDLVLRKNKADLDSTAFSCKDNFNQPITLNWSVANDPSGTISVSGSVPLNPTDTNLCRPATFTVSNPKGNGPWVVTFKGATDPTADLYVEVYFQANVSIGPNASGGC